MLQYGQVFQPDGARYSTDARYVTFGFGLGYRPVAAPEPPAPEVDDESLIRTDDLPVPTDDMESSEADPSQEELMLLIESAVETSDDRSKLLPPILFEYDSVDFIPCGEAALFYVRDAINQRRGPVVLEGHADTTGELDYNAELALRRAEAVRAWLIEHGVPASRLRVESYGERDNLTRESDDSRRQINRRVVVRFEEPEGGASREVRLPATNDSPTRAPEEPSEPAPSDEGPPKPAGETTSPTPEGCSVTPATSPKGKPFPQHEEADP